MIDFPWMVVSILMLLVLVGACTIAYGVVSAARKAWKIACGLEESLREAVLVAKGLQGDLSFLRQAAYGTTPNSGVPVAAEPESIIPRKPTQFPAPNFERFPVKVDEPDATEDQSPVVEDVSDEEFANYEQVENLRQMGYEPTPDPMEAPPEGRTVESE